MELTELAKQCGASIGIKTTVARGTEPYVFITGAQLAAFVERIRAQEREKAEQDSRRYRWLRDHAQRRVYYSPLVFACTAGDPPPRWEDAVYGEHLDIAIDAAEASHD